MVNVRSRLGQRIESIGHPEDSMPQHGKGARSRAAADSDSGDDLFIEAKGKQKGGRRGSKTTTFIARPLAPSTSAQPSDSPEAKSTPQVRHTGAVSSSSRTQTGLQHASEPRAFSAAAPEAPPIKGWKPPACFNGMRPSLSATSSLRLRALLDCHAVLSSASSVLT